MKENTNLKKWKDLSPGDLFAFVNENNSLLKTQKEENSNMSIFLNWAGKYYTNGWLSARLFMVETSEIINFELKEEDYVFYINI